MILAKNKAGLKKYIQLFKDQKKTIGFVPTMGALHKGHISLVKRAIDENNISVVSIFINPTQFNKQEDLEKYPRTQEKDLQVLEENHCDIVFMPTEKEMYPEQDTRVFDFNGLDKVLEGKYRQDHFNGVAQIVSKLFELVEPNRAYFGLKDYQQYVIIKLLVEKYFAGRNIEIVPCEIIRDSDGLALSSRNVRLNSHQRENAVLISQTLFEAKKRKEEMTIDQMKKWVKDTIQNNKFLELEYFDIVDETNLMSVSSWEDKKNLICCIAVNVGDIRLIDNIKL